MIYDINVGRDGAVGIISYYGLDGSGDQIPVGVIFSSPFLTGPGAHPASYTMSTGSLSRW
jgi:hypothetical protein